MKVKELIDELNKADPESEVQFMMDDGCCGDWLDLECYGADTLDVGETLPLIQVRFHPVPGYVSCRQGSATKRAHEAYWKEHNPSVLEREKNRKS
jgi:hypothetical protein